MLDKIRHLTYSTFNDCVWMVPWRIYDVRHYDRYGNRHSYLLIDDTI